MKKNILASFTAAFSMLTSSAVLANLPYYPIEFPRDEAAHLTDVPYPVSTMSEWWYYNGKLTSDKGRQFGFYINYSYTKIVVDGKPLIVPIYHIQISDIDKQRVYGNRIFCDNKYTYFSTKDLHIALTDSIMLQKIGATHHASGVVKSEQGPTLEYSLEFIPKSKPLLAGKTGLVDMWDKTNSYYYSYTHMQMHGYIKIGNEKFEIDPEKSLSWMDHQWGDFIVAPWNQWQWASVQLENGIELDLAVIMDKITHKPMTKWVNIVMPDDSRIHLTRHEDFDYVDHGIPPGHKYPQEYDLNIPSINLKLNLKSLVPGQDVNDVWEGVSEAQGTYNGEFIRGQATTESTIK